jgi:hypothetical protein
MEKDVDEVGKIAHFIKLKIEELDREVKSDSTCSCFKLYISRLPVLLSFLMGPEFSK